jgi:hypothetical protein
MDETFKQRIYFGKCFTTILVSILLVCLSAVCCLKSSDSINKTCYWIRVWNFVCHPYPKSLDHLELRWLPCGTAVAHAWPFRRYCVSLQRCLTPSHSEGTVWTYGGGSRLAIQNVPCEPTAVAHAWPFRMYHVSLQRWLTPGHSEGTVWAYSDGSRLVIQK